MDVVKVNEALDYLTSQGYFVENLWHIDDVQDIFNCTEQQAREVLDRAVCGEYIIEQINDRIMTFGRKDNLKEL